MSLNEMIAALEALKEQHGGDVDVTAWHYGGGLDDLCVVKPRHDAELNVVVMEPRGAHSSGARQ